MNFVLHPLGNAGKVSDWGGTCSDWGCRHSHKTTDLWNVVNKRDLTITQSALRPPHAHVSKDRKSSQYLLVHKALSHTTSLIPVTPTKEARQVLLFSFNR